MDAPTTRQRGPKRTPLERDKDRRRLVALRLEGKNQEAIATELGISRQQVSYDLGVIRREWTREMLADLDTATRAELDRLDSIEADAIAAFQASRTDANPGGDPRFLDIRVKCAAQRSRILGIAAPAKVDMRSISMRADVTQEPVYHERIRKFAAQYGYTVEQYAASMFADTQVVATPPALDAGEPGAQDQSA